MSECLFCKIIEGELSGIKIWEDEDHVAILDAFPTHYGQVLVLTKKHFGSHVYDLPKKDYKDLMLASKKVAKYLERGLRADRILTIIEGLEIDHVHIKLYPFFDKEGKGLGLHAGEKADEKDLNDIAKKIKENNK